MVVKWISGEQLSRSSQGFGERACGLAFPYQETLTWLREDGRDGRGCRGWAPLSPPTLTFRAAEPGNTLHSKVRGPPVRSRLQKLRSLDEPSGLILV